MGMQGTGEDQEARMVTRAVGVALVALVVTGLTAAGCQERVCRRGEHAVRSIEAPETGRTCVRDGDPPPTGYEEYPPGEAPTYVD